MSDPPSDLPKSESVPAIMRLLSDDRLARRAAKGDRRAFEAIYQRYHQDLYRFCLAMIGNPQDAQDALQSTMVKVLRALPGEERQIKLKPWLYRIARNETVEIVRRRRDNEELSVNQPAASTLAETTEARERLRMLLEDLEQLPQRQRGVLLMRELSGLEFAEIGASFGTSAAVARQTLYEARVNLRQLEEGRERHCDEVRRELSEVDGRTIRRRKLRAHLRACPSCRAFQEELTRRREDLTALSPLPLAVAADLLRGALGSSSGAAARANFAAGGGLGGAIGAGKAIATSAMVKSAATAAVVAVVGVSAADRSGAIDLPLPGQSHDVPTRAIPETIGPVPQVGENAVSAAGGLGSPTKPGGIVTSQGTRSEKLDEGESATAASGEATAAAESSPSQVGKSPPGGGHGRSSAERQGRPDHLPSASEKGQQTAAAHKPARAASPPGHGNATEDGGKPVGSGSAPVTKPAPQPKADAPPRAPPAAEPPTQVEAGVAHGPPASPPGSSAE